MSNRPYQKPEPLIYAPPPAPGYIVLYQDNHLIALSKASGLLTVPGKPSEHSDCLESRVQADFPSAQVVHRLDMDTSGVIIMALDKKSLAMLSMQFEKRQTRKTYAARVFGHLQSSEGTVSLPLVCDWPNRPKQMVDHVRGKEAITDWIVEEYEENATRIKLFPRTGRSHQLRVHMAELGHPILGDNLYAHNDAYEAVSRLQLHAERLAIRHPASGEQCEFFSECDF